MAEPRQQPGCSRQDYGTPPEFLQAVKAKLRIVDFTIDLAADAANRVTDGYFDRHDDALTKSWPEVGWNWLNPPYSDIAPWAKRCAELRARGGSVVLLVPAGIGSNWFRDHVHGKALVLALNGRLTFEGCTAPYPKDCILALYSPEIAPGFDVWNWRETAVGQHKSGREDPVLRDG